MIALMIALQATSVASVTPPAITQPVIIQCRVAAPPIRGSDDTVSFVVAACGQRAVAIGPLKHYSAVMNAVTGSVVVVGQRGNKPTVLMVAQTASGVIVNDVTRDLARLAGRFGDLGLGPFTVDTSRFVLDGSIGIGATGGMRWLDLKPYAAQALLIATATATPVAAGSANAVKSN